MTIQTVRREEFTVRGLSVRTTNGNETGPETGRITGLWQEFARVAGSCASERCRVYGVYSDYDTDLNGEFAVTAALAGDFPHPAAREVRIPAGTYLRFAGSGPCPETVIRLWHEVWDYFSREEAPQRTYRCDYEEYAGGNEVAIHIGIHDGEEKA